MGKASSLSSISPQMAGTQPTAFKCLHARVIAGINASLFIALMLFHTGRIPS
ncbi:hypothetical protein KCP78_04175 [Salmonella enterica subsp. enterica]|nr:hypothetical protein KCP78_04175 [Salmonella enterica subsp. enterica]